MLFIFMFLKFHLIFEAPLYAVKMNIQENENINLELLNRNFLKMSKIRCQKLRFTLINRWLLIHCMWTLQVFHRHLLRTTCPQKSSDKVVLCVEERISLITCSVHVIKKVLWLFFIRIMMNIVKTWLVAHK